MKRIALFMLLGVLSVSPAFGEGEDAQVFLSPPETSLESLFQFEPSPLQVQIPSYSHESLGYLDWMGDEAPADKGVVETFRMLGDNTKKILGTPLRMFGKILPGEKGEAKTEQADKAAVDNAGRPKELLLNSKAEKYTLFDKEDAKKLASQKTVEDFAPEPNPKDKRFGDKLIKILVLTRDFGSED